MKKKSLRERVEIAETRERDAKRRMRDMDLRVRNANAISDGAMILTTVLAAKLGDEIHISAEEFNVSKHKCYVARRNEDGSLDLVLEELVKNS